LPCTCSITDQGEAPLHKVKIPRVAVCDPNEIARLGIARALESEGLRVVGTAADAAGSSFAPPTSS
jgi:hypothetical protein